MDDIEENEEDNIEGIEIEAETLTDEEEAERAADIIPELEIEED